MENTKTNLTKRYNLNEIIQTKNQKQKKDGGVIASQNKSPKNSREEN
ncbi:hypothetical protein GF376_00510 [Candidatus Peregrinibacteria bacterium]|nr:hypothetical protein [Candidatus Peregrinibacteria bacterium]